MWKVTGKFCMINMLSTIDYLWVQLLLFKTSRQFRNCLAMWRDQIKALCIDESICESLNLYYFENQRTVFFYHQIDKHALNRAIYLDLKINLSLHISEGITSLKEYQRLEEIYARRLRVESLKVIGNYNVFEMLEPCLKAQIKGLFGIKNLQMKLKLTQKPVNLKIYTLMSEGLTLEINSSTIKYFSVQEIVSLSAFHIIVDSPETSIIFEDLSSKYTKIKFKVTFINPDLETFEQFYGNYYELFNNQNCTILLDIKEGNENEANVESILDIILNEMPQHVNAKIQYNSQAFNSKYLGLFQQKMQGRLEITELDLSQSQTYKQDLLVKSLNVWQQNDTSTNILDVAQISHFQISDQLSFKIDSGVVFSLPKKIISPKSIQIQIGKDCKNNFSCIYSILRSLTELERIIELKIQIKTTFVVIQEELEALKKVYSILSKCTNIQILDFPYINQREMIQQFQNVLDSMRNSLKSVKLRIGCVDNTQHIPDNFAMVHEFITQLSQQNHQLRYIDVDVFCWYKCGLQKIKAMQFGNQQNPINLRIGFYGMMDNLTKEIIYSSKFPSPLEI
ncbi:hypothetical protein FGO68_gene12779 [Halteria grandinella]|uniref:Uncharacterized protein n=1 Tax=Halteria grandinella TaxID=5974 RepID=A0A8J8NSJ9_HALGN|nr:hypothetical protein FGO68_gene12779 [Halteria grandinella]